MEEHVVDKISVGVDMREFEIMRSGSQTTLCSEKIPTNIFFHISIFDL